MAASSPWSTSSDQLFKSTPTPGRASPDVLLRLFSDEDAYGTSLYVAALQLLNPEELVEFHPGTIKMEIEEGLRMREPIDENIFARLMAAIAITHTDVFYNDLGRFIEICNVLSGTPPTPDIFDPADVVEISWAVAEAELLNAGEDLEFNADIRSYIGQMLYLEGYTSLPPLLHMATMPPRPVIADVEGGHEITGTIVEAEQDRHKQLRDDLAQNMARLASQLSQLVGVSVQELFST